jgi:ubiquinone/menaquinone biosynthesis C-methylase UbiE
MDEVSSGSQMSKIRNFERGFFATHLINLGSRLNLFETLNSGKEGMTSQDVAGVLGLHEPYVKTWCQTAYHYGILDCDENEKFRLQPHLDEILGDRSHFKNYLANIELSVDCIGKLLEEFPDPYRTGRMLESSYTPEVSKAVSATTKNMHLAFAFMIFPKNEELRQKLEQGARLLEIGCGRGELLTNLAQAFGKSTFVGVDPDSHGIEAARNKIAQMGLIERVSVENMGGEELQYHGEFDLVLMVVSLHEIRPEFREIVVGKAYQALKPGGQIIILDFPYPGRIEEFRNPMYDMAILEQFFEICLGFVHLNTQERNKMLENAGFRDLRHMPIGKGMFELVRAAK